MLKDSPTLDKSSNLKVIRVNVDADSKEELLYA
jgi:hypothetical protein